MKKLLALGTLFTVVFANPSAFAEYYAGNQYDQDFVFCSGVADTQKGGGYDNWGNLESTEQEYMNIFVGCMASRGHQVSS